MAQQIKNALAMQEPQEMWVQSLGQEDPLEKEMATHSNILARAFHGQKTLAEKEGGSKGPCKFCQLRNKETNEQNETKTQPQPKS